MFGGGCGLGNTERSKKRWIEQPTKVRFPTKLQRVGQGTLEIEVICD